ncbi:hypothetical protein [Helicobacter sp. 23-1045]
MGGGKKSLKAPKSTKKSTKTIQKTTDSNSADYLTINPSSNNKTGGFVGVESTIVIYKANDWTTPSPAGTYYGKWYPEVNMPIHLIGGYQWYFYNKPHFNLGVRLKAFFGYGMVYHKEINGIKFEPGNNAGYIYGGKDSATVLGESETTSWSLIHTLYYGAEASFLWDFLDRGAHTLGVHFSPVGFNGSVEFEADIHNTTKGYITAMQNGVSFTQPINSKSTRAGETRVYLNKYYISFGLQYYYNIRHQIFVTYQHHWVTKHMAHYVKGYLKGTKQTTGSTGNHSGVVYFGYSYKF